MCTPDWGCSGEHVYSRRMLDPMTVGRVQLPVKPVWTPVAIFGSLGVCIYVPASRHWLISYSPIHLA